MKKLLSIVLTALICIAAVGCGKTDADVVGTEGTTASEENTFEVTTTPMGEDDVGTTVPTESTTEQATTEATTVTTEATTVTTTEATTVTTTVTTTVATTTEPPKELTDMEKLVGTWERRTSMEDTFLSWVIEWGYDPTYFDFGNCYTIAVYEYELQDGVLKQKFYSDKNSFEKCVSRFEKALIKGIKKNLLAEYYTEASLEAALEKAGYNSLEEYILGQFKPFTIENVLGYKDSVKSAYITVDDGQLRMAEDDDDIYYQYEFKSDDEFRIVAKIEGILRAVDGYPLVLKRK